MVLPERLTGDGRRGSIDVSDNDLVWRKVGGFSFPGDGQDCSFLLMEKGVSGTVACGVFLSVITVLQET